MIGRKNVVGPSWLRHRRNHLEAIAEVGMAKSIVSVPSTTDRRPRTDDRWRPWWRYAPAIATTREAGGLLPNDPLKGAPPKAKMPPSDATSQ